MSVGLIFYLIAAFLFFMAGVGAAFIPNGEIWGLFFIALGLACAGVAFPWRNNP